MDATHVRATQGSRVVLVVSAHLHKKGRKCRQCGARWTVKFTHKRPKVHVRRDGERMDSAILDYVGNNVAVECCRESNRKNAS